MVPRSPRAAPGQHLTARPWASARVGPVFYVGRTMAAPPRDPPVMGATSTSSATRASATPTAMRQPGRFFGGRWCPVVPGAVCGYCCTCGRAVHGVRVRALLPRVLVGRVVVGTLLVHVRGSLPGLGGGLMRWSFLRWRRPAKGRLGWRRPAKGRFWWRPARRGRRRATARARGWFARRRGGAGRRRGRRRRRARRATRPPSRRWRAATRRSRLRRGGPRWAPAAGRLR